jgi:hypothetical protein
MFNTVVNNSKVRRYAKFESSGNGLTHNSSNLRPLAYCLGFSINCKQGYITAVSTLLNGRRPSAIVFAVPLGIVDSV